MHGQQAMEESRGGYYANGQPLVPVVGKPIDIPFGTVDVEFACLVPGRDTEARHILARNFWSAAPTLSRRIIDIKALRQVALGINAADDRQFSLPMGSRQRAAFEWLFRQSFPLSIRILQIEHQRRDVNREE